MPGSRPSPERLAEFFAPRSVALVGATDRSTWSTTTYGNLTTHGDDNPVYLVNPRHDVVHEQRTFGSLKAIGEPVDLAFVMVGTESVVPVVADAVATGVRNIVVLSAGFAEAGSRGVELEHELREVVGRNDTIMLGPNAVGFVTSSPRRAPFATPIAGKLRPGGLSIVLDSGGLAGSVLNMAQARALGVNSIVSVGNQSTLDSADVLEYLIHDEQTRCVAMFVESVRRPSALLDSARAALEAGKPVVVLKVGRSEAGKRAALAHTGAVAGDAALARAALEGVGAVVVESLEDLVTTAGLLSARRRPGGRRTAVIAASGGACGLIADKAEDLGLELPALPEHTAQQLTAALPSFSHPSNPLDVTGYVVIDPYLQIRALEVISEDARGHFDQIVYQTLAPKAQHVGQSTMSRYRALAEAVSRSPVPVIVQAASGFDMTGQPTALAAELDLSMLDGIEHGMTAIGHAVDWAEGRATILARKRLGRSAANPRQRAYASGSGVWGEVRSRELLRRHGVPVTPGELASSPRAAVEHAATLGFPVALKLADETLLHKSDIGGVRLNLQDPASVESQADDLLRIAGNLGLSASLLVTPMRKGGLELLVSVTRDPTWGPTLAVGLGGIWVELLRDIRFGLLPIDKAAILDLLDSLRGSQLLYGARGTGAVDVDSAVDAIVALAGLYERLGDEIDTIEVNPLWIGPDRCEALDALAIWSSPVDTPALDPRRQ